MGEKTQASPWLFLAGLLLFGGSLVLFVADLWRGIDIFRSIAANAVGTVILIGWAAIDTLRDPDSEVDSVGGAAGTALLLYGLYLVLAGAVIAGTALVAHPRLDLGVAYLAFGIFAVVVGFLTFPRETIQGGDDDAEPDTDADESA